MVIWLIRNAGQFYKLRIMAQICFGVVDLASAIDPVRIK